MGQIKNIKLHIVTDIKVHKKVSVRNSEVRCVSMAGQLNPLKLAAALRLSHKQRVTRLFRKCSRNILDWAEDRASWREQHVILRDMFDQNKHLTDPTQIEKVVADAEKRLWSASTLNHTSTLCHLEV